MLVSSNPAIDRESGLAVGFQKAYWGTTHEYVCPPWRSRVSAPSEASDVSPNRPPAFKSAIQNLTTLGRRFQPSFADALNRVGHQLKKGDGHDRFRSPWIEPLVDDWLNSCSASERVFLFVNYMDAHEPYLTDPSELISFGQWLNTFRTPQDDLSYLSASDRNTSRSLAPILALYEQAIARLRERLDSFFGILQRHSRWENTILVITSDHGQAFGEHGAFLHTIRTVHESQLRIPMIVKLPHQAGGGGRGLGWATHADVAATVLSMASCANPAGTAWFDLRELIRSERPGPVISSNDALNPFYLKGGFISERRKRELSQALFAAYEGNMKLILEPATGKTLAFDIEKDPAELVNVWPANSSRLARLRGALSAVDDSVERTEQGHRLPEEVLARLRAWGYA
jgi:arylsulfatase A-like enzyme